YVLVAFVGPLLHLQLVEEADVGTLDSRLETVIGYVTHVHRDPSVLVWGTHVGQFQMWNEMSPHNWIVSALLYDGVPAATLRVGCYLGRFAALGPVRRGQPCPPARAGLWCGAFTALFIVGQTEPFLGIMHHLVAAFGLALLATTPPAPA